MITAGGILFYPTHQEGVLSACIQPFTVYVVQSEHCPNYQTCIFYKQELLGSRVEIGRQVVIGLYAACNSAAVQLRKEYEVWSRDEVRV